MPIKYSVVIPAYNIEQFHSEIIKYILDIHNNRDDIEFIIIDDGSNDRTTELFKKETNCVFFRQDNQGVSSARNKGIDLAKGKYILFLDADDGYSTQIFNTLDKYLNEDMDFLIFNYSLSNKKLNNPPSIRRYNSKEYLISLIGKEIFSHICSICWRKEFIIENNLYFPHGYGFGEDIYYIINATLHTQKKITYIPDILFNYQFENSGTVASPLDLNKISVIELYQSIEVSTPAIKEHLNYFIQRSYIYLIKIALKYGVKNQKAYDALIVLKHTLNIPIHIKPPFDFRLSKFILKYMPIIIFPLIRIS